MLKHFLFTFLLLGTAPLSVQAKSLDKALPAQETSVTRPESDVAKDALRKPFEMLKFAEVKPQQRVLELVPGGGYFTRVLSAALTPQGKLYGLVPKPHERLPDKLNQIFTTGYQGLQATAQTLPNVEALQQDLHQVQLPGEVDLVWTSQNYHDMYLYWGPEATHRLNQAVFAALKPGGIYLVSDHVGKAGSDLAAISALHRIDPALVKQQVEAAGFVLEAESQLLHNPADDHTLNVFDPSLRGQTDQFVFRFRKPASSK